MSLGLTGDEDLDGVRGPAKAPVRDGGPPRMDSSVIRFAIGEKATCRAWIANFAAPVARGVVSSTYDYHTNCDFCV